jgi:TAG lipase / steryl ester hydrolase / phospholipase A2 / LPA acyltransferase
MLSQKYSGDITIVPDISYTDYPVLMSNPTPEFLVEARLRGERATWPSIIPGYLSDE